MVNDKLSGFSILCELVLSSQGALVVYSVLPVMQFPGVVHIDIKSDNVKAKQRTGKFILLHEMPGGFAQFVFLSRGYRCLGAFIAIQVPGFDFNKYQCLPVPGDNVDFTFPAAVVPLQDPVSQFPQIHCSPLLAVFTGRHFSAGLYQARQL